MTTPATLVAPEAKVNVVVLSVAGFIALLKEASIASGVPQVRMEPARGFTEVTVGGVRGAPGFAASGFELVPQHPATTRANRNAGIQVLLTFNLRISFSSLPRCKAFSTIGRGPRGTRKFGCQQPFIKKP